MRFLDKAGICLFGGRFVEDLREFAFVDRFQMFIAAFELLEGLHDGFRHALMSLLRSTDEGELVAGGHPFVAVFVV